MTRKTLLIGAAYEDPDIPGVYTDLETWFSFLTSDVGGAWRAGEILILKDPTMEELAAAMTESRGFDYSFVVFCGHGEHVKLDKPWKETVLHFGTHGKVSESHINPGTPWCTLLLDCCRRDGDEADDRSFLKEGKSASFLNRIGVRFRFDEALNNAERGLVRIYAASVGQSAEDDLSFSKQLIHETRLAMTGFTGVMDQRAAVELTANAMEMTLPQQNPVYQGGRRLNHFPFAVNV